MRKSMRLFTFIVCLLATGIFFSCSNDDDNVVTHLSKYYVRTQIDYGPFVIEDHSNPFFTSIEGGNRGNSLVSFFGSDVNHKAIVDIDGYYPASAQGIEDQVKLGKAQIFIGNELHDDSSIMEYLNNKSHGLVLVMNVFPHDIGTATLSCVASKHNIDKVQRIDKNYIVAGTFSATLVNEQTGDAFKVSGDYNIPLKLKY